MNQLLENSILFFTDNENMTTYFGAAEAYELLKDKLKDEIEEEELDKLARDTSPLLRDSLYRFVFAVDGLLAHGWVREERKEDDIKKIYYVRKYDITPEMQYNAYLEFLEKHRIKP